ncbi:ATP-binding protein [Chondrinema litorale]|uniref:ATP-binding protein n=1 Tax=Chondrinema litorale TaxID=2994555 RepID=UPI002543B66B|nr:ATP-binding protein [Chondrinema litorale]UZR94731.1 ATP-binding protein [Chondrinema litorale]
MIIIIIISLFSFIFSFFLFITYDFYNYHTDKRKELQSLANLIGRNNTVFSDFTDLLETYSVPAQQDLYKVLPSRPTIIYGTVFDKNNTVFAFYDRNLLDTLLEKQGLSLNFSNELEVPDSSEVGKDSYFDFDISTLAENAATNRFSTNAQLVLKSSEYNPSNEADTEIHQEGFFTNLTYYGEIFIDQGYMDIYEPIFDKSGSRVATVFLRESLDASYARYYRYMFIIGFILLLTAGIIVPFAVVMQRSVSEPVLMLARFTKKISENSNYGERFQNIAKNEIGTLQKGINEMLEVIEFREKELIKAKNRAEQSARAKEDFLANMSHELRTPLNGVTGMAQALQDSDLSNQQHTWVKMLKSSAAILMELINDVLDISKIESGKLKIDSAPIEIENIIDTVVESNKPKFHEKGLLVTIDVDENTPEFVMGDHLRLSQILMNLLNNAIKFTQMGFIAIGNKIIKEDEHEIQIRFYVKDTGIGISKENFNKIFQNFTQEKSDTTRLYGGTGLGLSICKSLVEMQGGKMDLESEVGQGSTFSFELSFKKIAKEKIPEIRKEILSKKKDLIPFEHTCKILVAEDNETNQIVVKTFLDQWNVDVDMVENGLIAVEKLKQFDYDMVLMDVHMPEMDGYTATKTIRSMANPQKSKIAIIAMTAAVLQGESEKCFASGMDDYISKPLDKQILYEKIQNHLPETWKS